MVKLHSAKKVFVIQPQSFWQTLRKELLSPLTLVVIVFLGICYLVGIQFLLNYRLLVASVADHFAPSAVLSLFASLFLGSFTSFSADTLAFAIMLLNACFVGVNLVLLGKTLRALEQFGKVHLTIGGATVFSLVTAGCASCGLSLLSLLGLSATVSFLPYHGQELRVLSLILLLFSALYMLKKLHEAKYCRV